MEYLVSSNNIDDCPITVHDVKNDHASFGPDIAEVRGKTVMHKPDHTTICYVEIPREFLNLQNYVTLVDDLTFVKNYPFLIAMSCGIRFITVEHVPTSTAKQLSKSLKIIIRLYSCGHMVVKNILMDIEFEKPLIN